MISSCLFTLHFVEAISSDISGDIYLLALVGKYFPANMCSKVFQTILSGRRDHAQILILLTKVYLPTCRRFGKLETGR